MLQDYRIGFLIYSAEYIKKAGACAAGMKLRAAAWKHIPNLQPMKIDAVSRPHQKDRSMRSGNKSGQQPESVPNLQPIKRVETAGIDSGSSLNTYPWVSTNRKRYDQQIISRGWDESVDFRQQPENAYPITSRRTAQPTDYANRRSGYYAQWRDKFFSARARLIELACCIYHSIARYIISRLSYVSYMMRSSLKGR